MAAKQYEESGSDSSHESDGEEGFLSFTSNEEFEEIILTDQGNISIQVMKEQSVCQNDSESKNKSQHSAPSVEKANKKPCLFSTSSTIEVVREEVSNYHLLLLQICKNEFSKQMPNDIK